jgi:hypothetical protein
MPGGERFTPEMQEKIQPALPPVEKAAIDSIKFLNDYIGLGQDMGDMAQKRIYPSWTTKAPFMPNYSEVRRELRNLGVRKHNANEYVYDMMDSYIGYPEDYLAD